MFRIVNRPLACRGCALDPIADAFSDPEGTCANGVMLVGESLGYHEAEAGYPFRPHAPAGSVLDRAIRAVGTSREQYGLWNLVGCRPPNNELNGAEWERGAIEHCKVHFRRVVAKFRPKVIMALGAVPTRALTGLTGDCQTLDYLRGYVFWSDEFNCFVVPSYHPSGIVRGMWPLFQVLCRDLRKAVDVAKNGHNPPKLHYTERGNEHNLKAMYDELVSDPELPVSIDIETDYLLQTEKTLEDGDGEILLQTGQQKQDITQINLSLGECEGSVFTPLPVHMRLFKAICELPNPKIGQNIWLFDKPVMEPSGIFMQGDMLDVMWCLRGDTRVALWNGEYRPIKQIVDKRQTLTLKGMNKKGEVIPIEITDWHKREVAGQRWLRITTDGTRYPIICTPDHKIYVERQGWTCADQVCSGDLLRLPNVGSDSPKVSQKAAVTAVTEVKDQTTSGLNSIRYCLSVDHESHGFFTAGGFVHNCFHHVYPDLPGKKGKMSGSGGDDEDGSVANLQYIASFADYNAPWKHLSSSSPELYGCLHGRSLVELADGSFERIDRLVNAAYSGKVAAGFDADGKRIYTRVTNWIKNKFDSKDWHSVITEHSRGGRWGVLTTRYTPDHKLKTRNGWKAISKLTTRDYLEVPGCLELTHVQQQVVLGSMCGDGSLSNRNSGGWASLSITHCEKQKPYLEWKAKLLGDLVDTNIQPVKDKGIITIDGKTTLSKGFWKVSTKCHPELKSVYSEVYQSTSKRHAGKWLDQLGWLGIAIAYQDNGTLVSDKYPRFYLPFSQDECMLFKQRLSQLGIETGKISFSKGCCLIGVCMQSAPVFFKRVAKYIHSSMLYKIPACWQTEYVLTVCDKSTRPFYSQVKKVFKNPSKIKGSNYSYCLDVAHESHAFCTPYEIAHNCADADSPIRAYWMLNGVMTELGILQGYYDLVQDMMPVLDGMRRRGIPITRNVLIELLGFLTGEIEVITKRIQTYIPQSILPTKPAKGYKKTPKSTEGMVQKEFIVEGGRLNCKCWKIRRKNLEYYAQSEFAQLDDKGRLRAPDPECLICDGSGSLNIETHSEVRWCKTEPFNVGSPKQMFAYAYHRKHEVPKNSKKKYAMDAETVTKLAKKYNDPLYTDCVAERKLEKMRGTYALGWLNATDAAGFVHSSVAFYPATQQLSSRKPNSQNMPNVQKQGKIAEMFASAIEAKPGYSIVSFDWKSFHAQTLGFEAQDPTYIRLAKIDIHSYLATWMLKIPHCEVALEWPDEELRDWLNWYKKNYHLADGTEFKTVRDKQAKPGILGYGFGLGSEKLYKLNEDSFNNVLEADTVLKTLDRTFPKVAAYRSAIPLIAKKQGGWLTTLFGSIRWFWDIQRYNFKWRRYDHGGDWEKCIAYGPAASAFGHCKQTMVMMDRFDHNLVQVPAVEAMNERYGLSNQVHDELFYHCRNELVEECLYTVKPVMERESNVLLMQWPGANGKGLAVEVEAKVGTTRANLKEVKV